jgi:crossover junction endodeoxyribonuclease RusA
MTTQYAIDLPYPMGTGNTAIRHGRGVNYLSADAKRYRSIVAESCMAQYVHGLKLKGPLRLYVVANPPDNKARDADNVLKVLCDALTKAGVWIDDSNKVIRSIAFSWDAVVAGGALMLTIVELDDLGH